MPDAAADRPLRVCAPRAQRVPLAVDDRPNGASLDRSNGAT